MVSTRVTRWRTRITAFLKKYGENAKLHNLSGVFNATTNENVLTETTTTVRVSPPLRPSRRFGDDGDVRRGAERRYIAAGSVVPAVGDQLEINSHRLRIEVVGDQTVEGDSVFYAIELVR